MRRRTGLPLAALGLVLLLAWAAHGAEAFTVVPAARLLAAGRGALSSGAWEPVGSVRDVRVPAGAAALAGRLAGPGFTQVDVRVDGRLVRRVGIRWKQPSVVKRGQQVVVRARFGGVEGEIVGEALSDGAPGDVIRVRNLGTRKLLVGRVTDAGEVEVGR